MVIIGLGPRLRRLGWTISPYIGEPECNGVAERFMRTLKERCISGAPPPGPRFAVCQPSRSF